MIKFKKIASIICSLITIPSSFRASASNSITCDLDDYDSDTYSFDDSEEFIDYDDKMPYHTLIDKVNKYKECVVAYPYISAFIGIFTLYGLKKAYNALEYVTNFVSHLKKCDWPENIKLSEYFRLVTNLTNKAYSSPHLENIIDKFIDSFNENTEINENNIVPATLTTSWYASLLKHSKLKDNTKLSKKSLKFCKAL